MGVEDLSLGLSVALNRPMNALVMNVTENELNHKIECHQIGLGVCTSLTFGESRIKVVADMRNR